MMIAQMARSRLDVQLLVIFTPKSDRIWLTGPVFISRKFQQTQIATSDATYGKKNTARKNFAPLTALLSTSASPSAQAMVIGTVARV